MKRLWANEPADNKSNNKKSKCVADHDETSMCSLSNMPLEILEEIIKKLPYSEYGRVRGTCTRLRNAADDILIRKLGYNLRTFSGGDAMPSVECLCSKIFHQLSWPYMRYGCRSMAAGLYVLLLNSIVINSNCTTEFPPFLDNYIDTFYRCIDCQVGDPHTQLSRLLHLVTILGFLNKLTNVDRDEKLIDSRKLKLNFIMNGTYFYRCNRTLRHRIAYPELRKYVVLFLGDVLLSTLMDTSIMYNIVPSVYVHKVYYFHDKIVPHSIFKNGLFVYGNRCERCEGGAVKDTLLLEFTIGGSNKVLQFLRTAPDEGDWDELPTDNFTVTINIMCKEVEKSGFPTNCSFQM